MGKDDNLRHLLLLVLYSGLFEYGLRTRIVGSVESTPSAGKDPSMDFIPLTARCDKDLVTCMWVGHGSCVTWQAKQDISIILRTFVDERLDLHFRQV